MEAYEEKILALRRGLHDRIDEVVQAAKASELGGGPAWDAVLRRLEVPPLSIDERTDLLRTGVPMKQGALPIEVRRAIQKVHDDFSESFRVLSDEIDQLEDSPDLDESDSDLSEEDDEPEDSPDLSEGLARISKDLIDVVNLAMKRYIDQVRPVANLGSVFANVMASTPKFGEMMEKEGVKTLKCKSCGAARPAETDMKICDFCGGPFF
ncbi:MAG: hypothetical protein O6952_09755 [Planctomycetota bacterium]|nr:hypothetical protein [Planctomycetota bacterium]